MIRDYPGAMVDGKRNPKGLPLAPILYTTWPRWIAPSKEKTVRVSLPKAKSCKKVAAETTEKDFF